MPFLPCRHPFECGRWFDISWSKPLSTRRTRLFDRNRGESSPFHSSRHPDNLPLTFLPNFSSFSLSLSFFPLFSFPSFSLFPFHIDSRKIWINSRKYDQNLSSFSSILVSWKIWILKFDYSENTSIFVFAYFFSLLLSSHRCRPGKNLNKFLVETRRFEHLAEIPRSGKNVTNQISLL